MLARARNGHTVSAVQAQLHSMLERHDRLGSEVAELQLHAHALETARREALVTALKGGVRRRGRVSLPEGGTSGVMGGGLDAFTEEEEEDVCVGEHVHEQVLHYTRFDMNERVQAAD